MSDSEPLPAQPFWRPANRALDRTGFLSLGVRIVPTTTTMSYQAIPAAPLDDEPARRRSFVTGALVAVAMFAAGAVAGTAVVRRAGAASPMLRRRRGRRRARQRDDAELGPVHRERRLHGLGLAGQRVAQVHDAVRVRHGERRRGYAIGVQHGEGVFYNKKRINLNSTVTMPSGGELYFNARGKFDKERGVDD